MVLVDSSVWIAFLRGAETPEVGRLATLRLGEILVGDLILLEVLQGARDDAHAAMLERDLRRFQLAPLLTDALAVKAAKNFRTLRARGLTIRKAVDIVIGSFCIETGISLLHNDRDFDPMVDHLGLKVA